MIKNNFLRLDLYATTMIRGSHIEWPDRGSFALSVLPRDATITSIDGDSTDVGSCKSLTFQNN